MSFGNRKKGNPRRWVCFLLAAALLLGMGWLYARLRPTITTLACAQTRTYATSVISSVIYNELVREKADYGSFVQLQYNGSGGVASLQTDIVGLGTLQTQITNRLVEEIALFRDQTVSIPLGNILGGYWFSGRGPAMDFRLIPANTVETQVVNVFDGAGLNQTRHQIMLNVRLHITAISAGCRAAAEIDTNFVLAETVIVGQVPESYTKVYEATDSLTGVINDYGAENYMDD